VACLYAAVGYWFIEGLTEWMALRNATLFSHLFPNDPHELWMRLTVAAAVSGIIVVVFSLQRKAQSLHLADQYQRRLEEQVRLRTAQLAEAIRNLNKDIEDRQQAEAELATYRYHLEELVEQRAGEVQQANKKLRQEIAERQQAERDMKMANQMLEAKHQALQKKTQLLKGILEQVGIEKSEVEERISANLHKVVRPTLRLLRQRLGTTERDLVDLVDSGLRDIASPFASRLESAFARLTPREIEVCNLIREGLSSKEVADACNVSVETVGEWRKRVRRKLGISNQRVNLASFLKSVSQPVPKLVPDSGLHAADQVHNN
jgi:DNA-binding CsgD family transcriptional regulator